MTVYLPFTEFHRRSLFTEKFQAVKENDLDTALIKHSSSQA